MAPRPDDPDDGVPSQGADVPDETDPPSDEDVWNGIVAQLGDLAGYDGTAPVEPEAATPLEFPVAPWIAESRVVRPAPDLSGRDWEGSAQFDEAEATVDSEEHFVPPDPGPVLGGDPLLTMAWIAAVGMPLFLLIVVIAWPTAPAALIQAAAVVFVLGVGVLLWRMPNRREPGDDDTGAVV
ncbi:hypothetical protein [Cellulomonas sp. URHD0024]|uniref:hypothetical protein n=1 Tax=Cellulomonas sp. URHD0024 TaxID=1302620 RepID=UPI00040618F2|nr:hypothetical protein [Cellulomonas sp. URHD0024]